MLGLKLETNFKHGLNQIKNVLYLGKVPSLLNMRLYDKGELFRMQNSEHWLHKLVHFLSYTPDIDYYYYCF